MAGSRKLSFRGILALAVRLLAAAFLLAVAGCAIVGITYRDYTGIYADTVRQRDTTLYIVIHHDGIDRPTSISEIEYQHKVINQWDSGFGYNFYLKDGKVYQMNGINHSTSHAYGYNHNAVSVCVHQRDKYDARTRANLYVLLWYLKIRYRISKDRIVGHGELPNQRETICPDMNMDSIRTLFYDL